MTAHTRSKIIGGRYVLLNIQIDTHADGRGSVSKQVNVSKAIYINTYISVVFKELVKIVSASCFQGIRKNSHV